MLVEARLEWLARGPIGHVQGQSLEDLAAACEISKPTAALSVRTLEAVGRITRTVRRGHHPTAYRLVGQPLRLRFWAPERTRKSPRGT